VSIERTRSERGWVSERGCRTLSRLVAELQSRIVGLRAAWVHFHQLSLARGELVGEACPGRVDDRKEQRSKDQKGDEREAPAVC
jgi:hypothetical protein